MAEKLEGWLRSEALDVRIAVELDPAMLDPAKVQGLVEQIRWQVAEGMQQMLQAGQLSPELGEDQLREFCEQILKRMVVEQLQKELWAQGQAPGRCARWWPWRKAPACESAPRWWRLLRGGAWFYGPQGFRPCAERMAVVNVSSGG